MAITVKIVSDYNDRGTKQAKSAFGDLSKFAKMAGVAVAAAGAAIAKGLYEAAQAAAEDQKSFAQLENTMRNVVKASDALVAATDKQIGSMSMQFGIADDKLRPAFSNLIRATGSVTVSQEALRSAMDLSVATGKDLDSVSLALGKALNGQTTALVKMLPGLRGVVEEGMPAADILAAINGQVGGAAEANTRTFAGALERMKVIFGEMVETVGSWLLPALVQLADVLNNSLGKAFAYLSDVVGPKVEAQFAAVSQVFRDEIAPVLNDYVIPALEYLFGVFRDRILPIMQAVQKQLTENLGRAFAMLREKLDENRDAFVKLRDFMDKALTFIQRYLVPVLLELGGRVFNIVLAAVGRAIDIFFKLGEIVGPVMRSVGSVVQTVVKGIVGGINAAIDAINAFIGIYNRLPGFMKPMGNIGTLPNIELPTFDLTNYKPGGFGYFGENRGDMGKAGVGGLNLGGVGAAPGGSSGGRSAAAPSMGADGSGPSAASLGLALDLSNWKPPADFLAGYDPFAGMGFNINVNGGLATSAEIGAAVVDAIKQYTNVAGPADIAVA